MSYQSTVDAIRSAANEVNPSGTFRHGRRLDASQGSIADTFPVIHLYPWTISDGVDPDFIDTHPILLGFWKQDSPDTTPEQREAIIAEMDEMVTAFKEILTGNKLLKLTNFLREPQYQMMSGTVSGMAIRFNLQNFTPC